MMFILDKYSMCSTIQIQTIPELGYTLSAHLSEMGALTSRFNRELLGLQYFAF